MCPSLQRSHIFWAEGVVGEEENNEILKKKKKTKQANLSEARPTFLPFQFPRFPGLAQLAFISPTQRPGPPTHLSPLCLQGEGPLSPDRVTCPRDQSAFMDFQVPGPKERRPPWT